MARRIFKNMPLDPILKFIKKYLLAVIQFFKKHAVIILICIIALSLRVWGINFGLPDFHLHSDENGYVAAVMSAFDKNVKSPFEEGLPLNSFFYLLALFFLLYKKFFTHISIGYDFWWWGRLLSAILSAGSVFLTYLTGKKLFNKKVGLLSALILSVTFIDVLVGHYIKEDVYLQFFGLLAILFFISAVEKEKIYTYILTIVFIILAGLAKINGLFYGLPFIFWGVVKSSKHENLAKKIINKRSLFVFICLVCFACVVVLNNPLSYRNVDSASGKLEKNVSLGQKFSFDKMLTPEPNGQVFSSDQDGIKNYIWWPAYLMTSGFYYPLFFLIIFGLICFCLGYGKEKKHEAIKYIILMVVLYYLLLSLQHNRFDRWVTVITPFLAIFSASGIIYFLERARDAKFWKRVAAVLIFAILFFSFLRISLFDFFIAQRQDTVSQALEWIKNNYRLDQFLGSDGSGLVGTILFNQGYNINGLFTKESIENQNIFNFYGVPLILMSNSYQNIINYRATEEYKVLYDGLKLIFGKGELIKEFSNPLFEGGFFSPNYLASGSSVNIFHNTTVKIYKIPYLSTLKPLQFTYLFDEIKKNSKFLLPVLDNETESGQALVTNVENGWQGNIVIWPDMLIPNGKYKLVLGLKTNFNDVKYEMLGVEIWTAGRGKRIGYHSVYPQDFSLPNKYQNIEIPFELSESGRIYFSLYFSKAKDFQLWIDSIFLIKQ
jgi:hypothetical protein